MRLVHGYAERTYRIRVGQYRVLYEIHDDEVLVLVVPWHIARTRMSFGSTRSLTRSSGH
jgi:mRNA-degrading endonuclease RelE of RelBE toxin-antitoxin system